MCVGNCSPCFLFHFTLKSGAACSWSRSVYTVCTVNLIIDMFNYTHGALVSQVLQCCKQCWRLFAVCTSRCGLWLMQTDCRAFFLLHLQPCVRMTVSVCQLVCPSNTLVWKKTTWKHTTGHIAMELVFHFSQLRILDDCLFFKVTAFNEVFQWSFKCVIVYDVFTTPTSFVNGNTFTLKTNQRSACKYMCLCLCAQVGKVTVLTEGKVSVFQRIKANKKMA